MEVVQHISIATGSTLVWGGREGRMFGTGKKMVGAINVGKQRAGTPSSSSSLSGPGAGAGCGGLLEGLGRSGRGVELSR